MTRSRLVVLVSDERGRTIPTRGLAGWLRRLAPARARGVVSIALVSDARIRALNRKFRGKDAVTDVLSFPAGGPYPSHQPYQTYQPYQPYPPYQPLLGDIVISRTVARRQAEAAGHAWATELRVLALHGLLHLLGYDHEHDDGRMRRAEKRLRRKGGLGEGLIERARDSS